jgi:hypothetical protein
MFSAGLVNSVGGPLRSPRPAADEGGWMNREADTCPAHLVLDARAQTREKVHP